MPEIALCRNCTACADFTDAELQLLQDARMWKLQQRNVDDLFAGRLHYAAVERKDREARAEMWRGIYRRMLSTKKLSEPE
jgi:hypothetical protein